MAIKKTNIVVVDYGAGNLLSLERAINYLGYKATISSELNKIRQADTLFLPGVGSFSNAISSLKKLKLYKLILDHVKLEKKIFGICLGMQILAKVGHEGKKTKGFGFLKGDVTKLKSVNKSRVPHVGFNKVNFNPKIKLLKKLDKNSYFYFNHSYAIKDFELDNGFYSYTTHGEKFISIYEKKNIYATQFHPEKSQTNGLQILKNFLDL